MRENSSKPGKELSVPWPYNPKLLMTLDISSWVFIPFWFGLVCWIVALGNEGQRAYPHYTFVTEMLILAIGAPFVLFGIIWLMTRGHLEE
jgi:hypothetical protein